MISSVSFSHGVVASHQLTYSSACWKLAGAQCLTTQETELIRLVNGFRERRSLPAIPVSKSLVKVARTHVLDLQVNRPNHGRDARGMNCNMHSWSSQGYWMPVCYTGDHRYADLMRSKPGEITAKKYDEAGYELVYWSSETPVLPLRVLAAWLKSSQHRALLAESGKWAGIEFKAVGVGISDNFAALWFSSVRDPLGSLPPCPKEQK